MRVALMALTEEGGVPVRLGGRPVAWHQLQAALALGSERVVCLADAPGPALAAGSPVAGSSTRKRIEGAESGNAES